MPLSPQVATATARPKPLNQHACSRGESDNDFPSTYFFAAAEVNFVARRLVVGAENFIYGTTLLIYELRSDHAEEEA